MDWQTEWGYLMNWGAWFVLIIAMASFLYCVGRIVLSDTRIDEAQKLMWPLIASAIASSAGGIVVRFFN
ncbi:hypothetical protein CGZ93_10410 [Enemella dayhoffiae]|uniref:Uncharacterized protein n=1 Tax=Enemella dayhoffiae TaxID=2016507 RepID=A0A255H1K3_9ACTN|nr:hypothetical protein [Enemella dayhoffiae]OYO21482.1 hypothetical protein CGZ93_10410 [Enemella dayhoffiae]